MATQAETRSAIQPDTHLSQNIERRIKKLREIEPQVGGYRLSHRLAVKEVADALGDDKRDAIALEIDNARLKQAELDLFDELALKRAKIAELYGRLGAQARTVS